MRTITCTIESACDGRTVKDILTHTLLVSDGLCSRLKRRSGSILLNGESVYVTQRVQAGDILCVSVGDPEKDTRMIPMPMPLSIIYEDEDLLVLNKPDGLAVHPARDPNEITLENALAAYLSDTDNPHPVSRLDRGTTGLMCVAKSGWAHSWMKTVQHTDGMEKTYLALCVGTPSPMRGTVDAPIGFYEGSGYRRIVRPDGAPSVSAYAVLETWGDISLVQLTPQTGRTHQLRVHMAYIGHPLLGDWLYGERSDRIARPALHAATLAFLHPLLGRRIELSAPLPADMAYIAAHA